MDFFSYHIPNLVGVGATFASVYGAFAKFDSDQSDDNRKFVRDWLLGLKADDRQWRTFFNEVFALFFGPKHLSIKCAARSMILSTLIIIMINIVWLGTHPLLFNELKEAPGNVLVSAAVTIVSACIIDYLSLWKTRILLIKGNLLNAGSLTLLLVLVDFVATSLLFVFFFTLIIFVFFNIVGGIKVPTTSIVHELLHDISIGTTDFPARLIYLAALFTSAWLWVYLIVAHLMRLMRFVPPLLKQISKVTDFQDHPVRTLGYIAATVSAGVALILTIV